MLAITEARKGFGYVAPNPPVGCVILDKDGMLLSKGYHHRCGDHHAEIDALNNLSDKSLLKDATVFVTLEPCAHEGRTPSCAKTLSKYPLHSVVYGLKDPNPLVAGKGAQILEDNGIETVEFPELKEEVEELAEQFLHNMRTSSSFVALKIATSLDGKIGLKSGESKWITNTLSREQGHYYRGIYDATLVGVGTFLEDDPSLDVRHPLFINKENKVIVFDPNGRGKDFFQKSRLKVKHKDIYWASYKENYTPDETQWIPLDADKNGIISLKDFYRRTYQLGITSIYVEGGAKTVSQHLSQFCFHRFYQFIAPAIIGGNGSNYSDSFTIDKMSQKIELVPSKIEYLGNDIHVSGKPKGP